MTWSHGQIMADPTGYTRPRFNNLCHVTPNVKLNFRPVYFQRNVKSMLHSDAYNYYESKQD
jgi:hypothetical protein